MDIRAEQLSRRTTDPLTRRDHLMHTDIQDVCENPPSQECALKNTCGYPQINVTSGNRQHDRHNAESDCYTPASRAAAAARPKCRWRTAPTDLAMVGTGRQGVSKAQSSPHPQSCPQSKRLQEGRSAPDSCGESAGLNRQDRSSDMRRGTPRPDPVQRVPPDGWLLPTQRGDLARLRLRAGDGIAPFCFGSKGETTEIDFPGHMPGQLYRLISKL